MTEVKIIFLYNGQNEILKCKKDEYMIDIYKRYVKKINADLKNLFFFM